MKPIGGAHVAQPDLAVVKVAACDDRAAFVIQDMLAGRPSTATATGDRTTRVPGEPGVRLRCYLDVRQEVASR
ncbi:DUF6207 family protein [Streptomyces massasporeus]